jgi:tetratricopeptide (TPR) repeat protein
VALEWYRRSTWTPEDEADFHARLKRAAKHNKSQYPRIQALHLMEASPPLLEPALRLIDLAIENATHDMDVLVALSDRGTCLERMGRVEQALATYLEVVVRQPADRSPSTFAWLDYAWLVARNGNADDYAQALELLRMQDTYGLAFPIAVFKVEASRALILDAMGDNGAREAALLALDAARRTHSGLRYHPDLGLVAGIDPTIEGRLRRIAGTLD